MIRFKYALIDKRKPTRGGLKIVVRTILINQILELDLKYPFPTFVFV